MTLAMASVILPLAAYHPPSPPTTDTTSGLEKKPNRNIFSTQGGGRGQTLDRLIICLVKIFELVIINSTYCKFIRGHFISLEKN